MSVYIYIYMYMYIYIYICAYTRTTTARDIHNAGLNMTAMAAGQPRHKIGFGPQATGAELKGQLPCS